jgi:uncharacterized damage-inducible protein DinB
VQGYRGASLQRRDTSDGVEFMTVLSFESLDAVRAFAGEDHESAYVPDRARRLLTRFDERSAHYTLVAPAASDDERGPAERTPGPVLAATLSMVVEGEGWHGPSFREAVEGVDPEVAAARPVHGAHSIWELVHHVGAWAEIVRERVVGRAPKVTQERNFPPVPAVTEANWSSAVAEAMARHKALAEQVATLDQIAQWERPGADQRLAGENVRGVIHHTLYHAGQIALLRRAAGIEPPAS